MPRGGKRLGAGRKVNALTTRTRETAEKAIEQGVTPLDVMLHNMRFAHQGVDAVLKAILAGDLEGMVAAEGEDVRLGALRQALALSAFSQACARDAAPFIHPRLAAVDGTDAKDREFVPLAERVKAYARKDAIDESAGKVVEMKRK